MLKGMPSCQTRQSLEWGLWLRKLRSLTTLLSYTLSINNLHQSESTEMMQERYNKMFLHILLDLDLKCQSIC